MSENRLKIAVCQLRTELVKEQTLKKAEDMVREAAQNGAQIVCLPEMWSCPYSKWYFYAFSDAENGETQREMSRWARENGIILVGGSIPERAGDKLYNTCFVYDKTGAQIAKHRKVHLFDVDIEGGVSFKESDSFAAGDSVCAFDTEYGRIGVIICFDIRFPELVRATAKRGAQVIFCPAQFNMTTGPLHWELSIRARAMDNELYFVGASAARFEGFGYECWGHSTIAGPFGMIEASCDEKEQNLYCELELDRISSVRQQLPTFLHLREDVYSVAK